MVSGVILCLLGVAITNVVATTFPILKRQDNVANRNNTFAAITPSEKVVWVSCYEDSAAAELGAVSCARLIAPLDYGNTTLGQIQLAIIKLGAAEKTNRTVFFNPGGPGDDPVESITSKAALLRIQVGNDTDIIAIVPRGVGSTFPPITCDATESASTRRLWEIQDTQPGYTDKSVAENYAIGKALGLDCGLVTPKLIPYVGTVHVARDLDYVSRLLGQDKLLYLGHSYGTVLGATYAALFPDRVDRMVLDGVVDSNDWYVSAASKDPNLDISAADTALTHFFQSCFAAGPKACAFWYNSTAQIRAHFLEADRRILQSPLPVPGFGLLKAPLWRSGVYNALYKPAKGFPLLASVAAEVYNRTAGPAIQAYLEIVGAAGSSSEAPLVDPDTGLQNSPVAGQVIPCSDSTPGAADVGIRALDGIYEEYRGVSRFFAGVSSQYSFICLGAQLPAKDRYTAKFQNIKTSNPILFVGNTADPTTPLRNALRMSQSFPGSAVLTINGTGHISFSATRDNGLECATKWIAPYFRDGTLPPAGTVCQGRQDPFSRSED